jgi:hypothetical protein
MEILLADPEWNPTGGSQENRIVHADWGTCLAKRSGRWPDFGGRELVRESLFFRAISVS